MDGQAELFPPSLRAQYDDGTYPKGFWDALDDNIHLFDGFIALARRMQQRGFKHYSSRTIIHVMRHHTALSEGPAKPLKINDHWSSGFSRLAMAMYPNEFANYFETREPPAKDKAIKLDGTPYHQDEDEEE